MSEADRESYEHHLAHAQDVIDDLQAQLQQAEQRLDIVAKRAEQEFTRAQVAQQEIETLKTHQRFLEKFRVADNGCWEWTAALVNSDGYGAFYYDGNRSGRAHRYAYQHYIGPIPEGLTIDHLCRNRKCVNPDHLEAVTNKENLRRGESPTAINARKTHCIHGHEFTPENTLWEKKGRACRECKRARNREADRKARAALAVPEPTPDNLENRARLRPSGQVATPAEKGTAPVSSCTRCGGRGGDCNLCGGSGVEAVPEPTEPHAACSACGYRDDARVTTCRACGGQMQPFGLAEPTEPPPEEQG